MSRDIKTFTDLDAWRQSHTLVVSLFTALKDVDVRDSLKNQMERCAVSITSNIAEGFGRQTKKDKIHFYIMARGSAYELQNQLIIARDTGKIDGATFNRLAEKSLDSIRLLHGLIRSIKRSDDAGS